MLNILQTQAHGVPITTLFMDKEVEYRRGYVMCPSLHSYYFEEPGNNRNFEAHIHNQ